MPETWYATEIQPTGPSSEIRTLHEICVPSMFERGFCRAVASIESFRGGRRRGASKRDVAAYRYTPAWAPGRLYIVKHCLQWEEDQQIHIGVLHRCRERDGHPLELDVWPVVRHESVWAFYQHIGWDFRSRRYRDAGGRAIRYSSVPET